MIMPAPEKRTFSLPAEQASYIDALVADGAYASASDVVGAGLEALRDREGTIDRWLREQVVPVYDAMIADPGRGIPAEQVMSAVRDRHAARLATAKRGA